MQLPLTSKFFVRDDPWLAATCGRPGLQGQAGGARGRSYSIWFNTANPVTLLRVIPDPANCSIICMTCPLGFP